MPDKCQQIFEQAAGKLAAIPGGYAELRIRDNLPDVLDWNDINREFCSALRLVGGTITESELDPFWNANRTFHELLQYVRENCDCSS
jgi:hypothetical protein